MKTLDAIKMLADECRERVSFLRSNILVLRRRREIRKSQLTKWNKEGCKQMKKKVEIVLKRRKQCKSISMAGFCRHEANMQKT